MCWSTKQVQDSLCSFVAQSKVPSWKFTTAHGKTEIIRNTCTTSSNLYKAWSLFIKEAHLYNAKLIVNQPNQVQIYVHFENMPAIKIVNGVYIDVSRADAVAAVDWRDKSLVDLEIEAEEFVQRAQKCGHALLL